jgi:drug/metabolite transporter (DMT)-like permease
MNTQRSDNARDTAFALAGVRIRQIVIGCNTYRDGAVQPPSPVWRGLANGLLGVAIFSITLPATRIAVAGLDATVVALGRAVIAAACAAVFLAWRRTPWPHGHGLRLALVSGCVVFGFPLLTSIAMRSLPASHGAIVIGLLPLSTAVFAMVFAHERPSIGFWICAAAGSATVIAYALIEGGGTPHAGDALLLGAVVFAGIGYAEGGRLSRTLGGPQVIAWALLLALPALVPVMTWRLMTHTAVHGAVSLAAWAALGYLGLFSMFFGFFFWYRGLAFGGVARVGQLQLLQPFLSVLAAALLVGEALRMRTIAFAIAVVVIVAIGRRFAV